MGTSEGLALGKTVLHYRIVERIGTGGAGIVYKAEDARLSRHVSLKFLNPAAQDDPQAFEPFQREARGGGHRPVFQGRTCTHSKLSDLSDVD